jgi:Uma2 family endonuclease
MATATEATQDVQTTRKKQAESLIGEHRFLIHNVSWEKYEALLEIFGDDGPRMNYCRGELELMSPLIRHERPKKLIAFIIEAVTEELDIPRKALGSTTYRRQMAEKGLEADECYYLFANAGKLTTQRRPDLEVDPPPDLAIEIEITTSLVDKLAIYAGIGVPEIWRYDGDALSVLLLQAEGSYVESPTSAAFPFLPMPEIARFLDEYDPSNETRWGRSFRAWVRETLLPLDRNADRPE